VEQKLFADALNCEVLGTEISDTAKRFPNTIEWDFHVVKDEWKGACDFIYTNSLDHSYKPLAALQGWISCLNDTGLLVVEWTEKLGSRVKTATAVDPFSGTANDVCQYINKAGGEVVEVKPIRYKKISKACSSSNAEVTLIFARRKA
jgi:hypothetical protein